jgi:hypothetical protein
MLGINDEGRNLNVAGSIPDGHSSSVDIGLIVFAMDNGLILHHTVVSVKVLESAQKKQIILLSGLVLMFLQVELRIFLQVQSSVMD